MMEEEKRRKRAVNWSDLPPEILMEIGKRLGFRVDVMRFRSVCKAWRESVPIKLKINKGDNFITIPRPSISYKTFSCSPLTGYCPVMNSNDSNVMMNNKPVSYVLTERTVHVIWPKKSQLNCRASCQGYGEREDWSSGRIMEFEEILPNTFRPNRIESESRFLDPLHMYFTKGVNMLDLPIYPVSKHYSIIAVSHPQGGGEEEESDMFHDRYYRCFNVVDKVVVLSKCNSYVSIMCPINDGDGDGDGVGDVLIVGALLPQGNVGLLRLLGPDLTPDPVGWRLVNFNHNHNGRFDDIVDLGGRLCVIDYYGRASVVDSNSLELIEIAAPPILRGLQFLQRRKRLVQHSGDLYMLIPCRCQVRGALRPQIKVYKLKVETREWVGVASLGDVAIFVGKDFSFAAPARNILSKAESYRNCILFHRTSFPLYHSPLFDDVKDLFFKKMSNLDVGLFDLPDGSNSRLALDYTQRLLIPADNCHEIVYDLPCCLAVSYKVRLQMNKTNLEVLASKRQRHNKDAICRREERDFRSS